MEGLPVAWGFLIVDQQITTNIHILATLDILIV